jgi:hypothetical protein
MRGKKFLTIGVAAATVATLSATALVEAGPAGAVGKVPVVTVHMNNGKIRLSSGNRLHSGRITFRGVTSAGGHGLQVIRLHRGYTPQQAISDVNKAFRGDLAAIARVDTKITWRGGAEVRPNKPGVFTITLRPGTFYFVDQNGPGFAKVTVFGKVPARAGIAHQSEVDAFTYGFVTSPNPDAIPASGTLEFHNHADQPHFLEIQRVKQGTTARQVRRVLNPTSHVRPTFLMRAHTSSGVVSPTFSEMLRYDLPRGEYLIACFWPDRLTGMPHAFMGMWKLVQLT